jgi:hypothetical protein
VFGDEIADRGISSVVLFNYINNLVNFTGGESGIRTHDTEFGISAHRAIICGEMTGFRA